MFLLQKSNKRASSRRQINIQGVKNDILILPPNVNRAILQVSSVNFELKSDEEQDVLIETYQSFLNALDCPIQIVIRVRELDVDSYLNDLEQKASLEKENIYRLQIQDYSGFVQSLIKNNKILTRYFYVVVPYVGKDSNNFELIKEQLSFNCDMIAKGLVRLGIQSKRLSSLEILDLFYSFYNQDQAKYQPISAQTLQLLQPVYMSKGAIA